MSYMPRAFSDKVTNFTDKPVVQCDVPGVKNTSLYDAIMIIAIKFCLYCF